MESEVPQILHEAVVPIELQNEGEVQQIKPEAVVLVEDVLVQDSPNEFIGRVIRHANVY
jgi:hypothetical protein